MLGCMLLMAIDSCVYTSVLRSPRLRATLFTRWMVYESILKFSGLKVE